MKSLQTDSSNTDTALVTLEEALSEKVPEIAQTSGSRYENVGQKHIKLELPHIQYANLGFR